MLPDDQFADDERLYRDERHRKVRRRERRPERDRWDGLDRAPEGSGRDRARPGRDRHRRRH